MIVARSESKNFTTKDTKESQRGVAPIPGMDVSDESWRQAALV